MTTKRERRALAKKVREAAAYVDRVGLHRGDLYDRDKLLALEPELAVTTTANAVENGVRCCTIGVLDGFGVHDDLIDEAGRFLASQHPRAEIIDIGADGTRFADIAVWNDKPSRRKKDVVELLTAFADHLEEGA